MKPQYLSLPRLKERRDELVKQAIKAADQENVVLLAEIAKASRKVNESIREMELIAR